MKPLQAVDGWDEMVEPSQDEFSVAMKHGAGHYADRPVTLLVRDPDHRLGRRPRLALRRQGRTPDTVFRSFLIDGRGRGRFYGWMPVQLRAMTVLVDEYGRGLVACDFGSRCRGVKSCGRGWSPD